MKKTEVLDTVFANLTKLSGMVKGEAHSVVTEIMDDLDRIGARRLQRDLDKRGKIINRQGTQLASRKRALVQVTKKAGSLEYLTIKLANENAGLQEQLKKGNSNV